MKKEPKWQRHCDKCNEWYRIVDGEWETIYTTRNPNKKELKGNDLWVGNVGNERRGKINGKT